MTGIVGCILKVNNDYFHHSSSMKKGQKIISPTISPPFRFIQREVPNPTCRGRGLVAPPVSKYLYQVRHRPLAVDWGKHETGREMPRLLCGAYVATGRCLLNIFIWWIFDDCTAVNDVLQYFMFTDVLTFQSGHLSSSRSCSDKGLRTRIDYERTNIVIDVGPK